MKRKRIIEAVIFLSNRQNLKKNMKCVALIKVKVLLILLKSNI